MAFSLLVQTFILNPLRLITKTGKKERKKNLVGKHGGVSTACARRTSQGLVQGVSECVNSRIDGERVGGIHSQDLLCRQAAAVAELVAKCLFTFTLTLASGGVDDKVAETRYGHNGLRDPDDGPDVSDSLFLGQLLVQGPRVPCDPHLVGHVELHGCAHERFGRQLRSEDDDDADFLRLDGLEYLGVVCVGPCEVFGVAQTDVGVNDPPSEQLQTVYAKGVVAVEEGDPAPAKVQDHPDHHVHDVSVGVHGSQERRVYGFLGED